MKTLLTTVLWCIAVHLHAADPSVTLYQTIEEDLLERGTFSELILKVSNPTKQTFYVLGLSITDIPYSVEVLKNSKWETVPPIRCGTGMSMRKFLPDSSIVFTADEAPLMEDDVTFRLRVYLYTEPDIWNLYTDPKHKPYVEVLSPSFSTKDFHKKRSEASKLPRLPGIEPTAAPTDAPAVPP